MNAPPWRRRAWRIAQRGLVLLLLILLTGAGYATYRVNRFNQHVFRDDHRVLPVPTEAARPTAVPPPVVPTTVVPGVAHAAPRPTPTLRPSVPTPTLLPYGTVRLTQRLEAGEPFSILLLGLAGPGHTGPYLTDSLQLLRLDPRTATVTLISLPRDLSVSLPRIAGRGGTWGKLNQAYQVGLGPVARDDPALPYARHARGGEAATQVVAQVLGVPIDAWASLDFVGFRRFIDALGGIEVDVERSFTDTRYPAHDNVDIDAGTTTIHFDAGCPRLDGERALIFVRSRYAPQDGSDFGRARRQQRLLAALQHQLFRVRTIPRVFALLTALEQHVHTSLSRREAQDLAGWAQAQAARGRRLHITHGGLDTTELLVATTSAQGAYVLQPRGGRGDYRAIHAYVRGLLAPPVDPGGPVAPVGTPPPATPTAGPACGR